MPISLIKGRLPCWRGVGCPLYLARTFFWLPGEERIALLRRRQPHRSRTFHPYPTNLTEVLTPLRRANKTLLTVELVPSFPSFPSDHRCHHSPTSKPLSPFTLAPSRNISFSAQPGGSPPSLLIRHQIASKGGSMVGWVISSAHGHPGLRLRRGAKTGRQRR